MHKNRKDIKIIDVFKVILITLFVLLVFKQMKEYLFFKNISDNNNVIKEKVMSITYKKPLERYTYKDKNGISVKITDIFNVKTETNNYIIYSNSSCKFLNYKTENLYIWPSDKEDFIYLSEEEKSVWRLFKGKVFNCYSFLYKK